jgi:hypothetical protein
MPCAQVASAGYHAVTINQIHAARRAFACQICGAAHPSDDEVLLELVRDVIKQSAYHVVRLHADPKQTKDPNSTKEMPPLRE